MIAHALIILFTAALIQGCGSCGESNLTGDAPETAPGDDEIVNEDAAGDTVDVVEVIEEWEIEPDSVCGNGILESGEECDGGSRPCNRQGCGGGTQECGPGCTWGECIEERMTVVAGPVVVSGDLGVKNGNFHSKNLFWTGSQFKLFYRAEESTSSDRADAFHSTVESNGELSGPPFLFTPGTLPLDHLHYMYDVSAAQVSGENPFAVLFTINESHAYFNLLDGEGLAVMDPGMAIWDWNAWDAYFLASHGEVAIAALCANGHGSVAFMNPSGEILGIDDLPYLDWPTVKNFEAVADGEGFTALMLDVRRDLGGEKRTFLMRVYDPAGTPLTEPTAILDRRFYSENILSATWTESHYGVVFAEYPDDHTYLRLQLFLMVVDGTGSVVVPPVVVGNAWGPSSVDLAWTGSEFGLVYPEPVLPQSEDPPGGETLLKLARFDEEGLPVADAVEVAAGYQSHAPSIVWNGSRYGVSWNEPYYTTMTGSLHFALVGCPE